MKIGQTIIVKAWGKFEEEKMTCVGIYGDPTFNALGYEFDNGMKLLDVELEQNFDLWNSRNGYEII